MGSRGLGFVRGLLTLFGDQHNWALHIGPHMRSAKQTEDRKHGTQVVQTYDAGPARAGTDRPFGALERTSCQVSHRGFDQIGRPEQYRTDHLASSWRRRKASLSYCRFQTE